MIKVKISRNYNYPDLFRQTPNESGIWDGISFTEEDINEADFVVILNSAATDFKIHANQGGVWLFLQEPPYEKKSYFKYHFRFVDEVISGFSEEIPNNFNCQAGLPWHLDKNFDYLKSLKYTDLSKNDRISWITSSTNTVPGHQPRLDFINFLHHQNFDFDLFGRGFTPIKDKFDGIAPYKYSIAVENYFANDYFTEKAVDCFLSWTMPIYNGCTNFEKYFPRESFVKIDITKPQESLEIIKEAIDNKLWERNLEAIGESRRLILEKYQLFPMITERIKLYYQNYPNPKKKKYKIPASGLTQLEELKKKIKRIF